MRAMLETIIFRNLAVVKIKTDQSKAKNAIESGADTLTIVLDNILTNDIHELPVFE
jgi:hypothetical protein